MDVVLSVLEHKEGERGSMEDSDGSGSVPHRTDEAGMDASIASFIVEGKLMGEDASDSCITEVVEECSTKSS